MCAMIRRYQNPIKHMKSILTSLALSWAFLTSNATLAADTYKIDPVHSYVGFSISHLVISTVKGKFNEVSGTLTLDDKKIKSAEGTIQVKSLDTGNAKRDEDVRGEAFFDA